MSRAFILVALVAFSVLSVANLTRTDPAWQELMIRWLEIAPKPPPIYSPPRTEFSECADAPRESKYGGNPLVSCYAALALRLGDPDLCDRLPTADADLAAACYSEYAYQTGNTTFCPNDNRDGCIARVAASVHNPELCGLISANSTTQVYEVGLLSTRSICEWYSSNSSLRSVLYQESDFPHGFVDLVVDQRRPSIESGLVDAWEMLIVSGCTGSLYHEYCRDYDYQIVLRQFANGTLSRLAFETEYARWAAPHTEPLSGFGAEAFLGKSGDGTNGYYYYVNVLDRSYYLKLSCIGSKASRDDCIARTRTVAGRITAS